MKALEYFFTDLDRAWSKRSGNAVTLRILGSTALMLQVEYERGTKDSDVLEAQDLPADARVRLLALAGKNTVLHERHRVYIDLVSNGIPFLPHGERWHELHQINANLEHLRLHVLDVVDVVVSKLKRFNANDQEDIRAMIEMDLVPHDKLIERFRSAVDVAAYSARAEHLPKYINYLHRVERDWLRVPETDVDLPDVDA